MTVITRYCFKSLTQNPFVVRRPGTSRHVILRAASTNKTSPTSDDAKEKSKITWMRGYIGAHSNTEPPDAKFLAVAAIVGGAGFYAWFIDPPKGS